jgi:ABC-type branched-subunit amino acid transport system substrate-binding protein
MRIKGNKQLARRKNMQTRTTSSWTRATGGLLVLIVLLLAACGGANSGSANTSPIKIGLIGPYTGPEGFIGPASLKGAQVAADYINANGGILGRQVQLITADTGGDAVDAVPALRKLINIDKVDMIIGPTSIEAQAVLPILQQSKIPDIIFGGTTQLDNLVSKYIWRAFPSDSELGTAMARYALDKGYTKAAIFFASNESAQTLVAPIRDAFQRHGGTIVANISVVPDQSSYRSEIEQLYAANPQVVFTQVDPQTGATLFSEIRELKGLGLPFIGTDVTAASDFVKAITPQVANQVLSALTGSSQGGGGRDVFAQLYTRKFGTAPVQLANYSYDGLMLLALAADAAGSTQGDAVGAKMKTIANPPGSMVSDYAIAYQDLKAGKKINYEGASGPLDFNDHNYVYEPFDVLQFDASGNPKVVTTITAEQLSGY